LSFELPEIAGVLSNPPSATHGVSDYQTVRQTSTAAENHFLTKIHAFH